MVVACSLPPAGHDRGRVLIFRPLRNRRKMVLTYRPLSELVPQVTSNALFYGETVLVPP